MFFSSAGKLLQYEAGGAQDESAYDIPFSLYTQEYSAEEGGIFIGPSKIYCTAQSGKTLTITRSNARKGTTSVSTASLAADGADTRVHRGDSASSSMSAVGSSDSSVQIQLTGTLQYPWSLLRMTAETQANRGRVGRA